MQPCKEGLMQKLIAQNFHCCLQLHSKSYLGAPNFRLHQYVYMRERERARASTIQFSMPQRIVHF